MSNIIPFDSDSSVALIPRMSGINADVLSYQAQFPHLSIKGKVFTLGKGSEKKVLTRIVDDEEETLQSLQMAVVRANTKYRVFYASAYVEGEDNKPPTCFSNDGVKPDASVRAPEYKTCQGCPQNIWGVRDGKGFACNQKTRMAVVDLGRLDEPFLLNVPAASRKSYQEAVEFCDNRKVDYNIVAMRLSFDKEAASPKLVFKVLGMLDKPTAVKVQSMYDAEIVHDMLGIKGTRSPAPNGDEVEAAAAARQAMATAKALPKPVPKVDADEIADAIVKPAKAAAKPSPDVDEDVAAVVAPKAKPKAPAKPAPKAEATDDDFMNEIDALLGASDD